MKPPLICLQFYCVSYKFLLHHFMSYLAICPGDLYAPWWHVPLNGLPVTQIIHPQWVSSSIFWLLSTRVTIIKLIIKHFTLNTTYSLFNLCIYFCSLTKQQPILVIPVLLFCLDFMEHPFSNPLAKLNYFALLSNWTHLPKSLPWMNLTICFL